MSGPTITRTTPGAGAYIAKERLYLSADGKTIVKHGDKRAATLLAGAGGEIDPAIIKRLGIEKLVEAEVHSAPPVTPKTISPEAVESRSTRPLKAERER